MLQPISRAQSAWCWVLVVFYGAAGATHLVNPIPFLTIVPHLVPQAPIVVAFTGVAELAGALGLAQPWSPRLRRAAGWGLAAYALCVWPANFQHLVNDLSRPELGLGLGYHIPRLLAQPLIIWLALWASGAIRWPFEPRG